MSNAPDREGLRGYTKRLRERAEATEGLPSASEDDKRSLAEDRDQLESAVERLVEIVGRHDALVTWVMTVFDHLRPDHKAALAAILEKPVTPNGLVDLWGALASAFHVGALGFESPVMKQLEWNANGAQARRGRSKDKLRADIWKLAEPHLQAKPGLTAQQLADEILGPLNEGRRQGRRRLDRPLKDLKKDTITRKLNEMMAERGLRVRRRANRVCTAS